MIAKLLMMALIEVPYVSLNSTPGPEPEVYLYLEGETEQIVHFRLYKVPDPYGYLTQNYRSGFRPKNVTGLKGNSVSSAYAAVKREKRTFRYWLREVLSFEFRNAVKSNLGIKSMESKVYNTDKKLPPLKGFPPVAEWDMEQPTISYSDEITIPGMDTMPQALYLLEADYSGTVTFIPVLKTTLFMEVKVATGKLLVYVSDSGIHPVPNTRVKVILNQKKELEGVTDPQGVMLTDMQDSVKNITVIAVTEDNRAVISGDYYYGWYGSSEPSVRAYIYTDRPIYKPGQTVHIAGLLRQKFRSEYLNMPYKTVVLKVYQGWGDTYLLSDTLRTDEFGAFSDSLSLPDNAKLGHYSISLEYDETEAGYFYFSVEEYVKPEFKVSVGVNRDKFVVGNRMKVSVSADYIFGAPLKDADVEVTVTRFVPWWFYYPEEPSSSVISKLNGTLDENGKASFEVEIPYDSLPYNYRVRAVVTGPDGRKQSASKWVRVYPCEFIPRIELSKFIYTDYDSVVYASVKVKTLDGEPASVGGEIVIYKGWHSDEVVLRQKFMTDKSGTAEIEFPVPSKPGEYFVVATVRDDRGRKMIATDWFYRSYSHYAWGGKGKFDVMIEKDTLSPGDIITGVVLAPFKDGAVLLTLAAGNMLISYDVLKVKNGMATINTPVPRDFSGRLELRFEIGGDYENSRYKTVLVIDSSKMLNVEITPMSEEYEPGQEAVIKLKVTDHDGRPVKAAFFLGVVDEAIYQIKKDHSGNIFDEFYCDYYQGWLWGFSSTYFSFYTDRNTDLTELAGAREKEGKAFAQMKEAAPAEQPPSVREKFKDTAFWTAKGRTGADGTAVIQFQLPDNITQWRITAKAFTKDTKLGQNTAKFFARKRVFVSLSMPRYLTEGDTVEIPTVIHNFLPATMEFSVDFQAEGLKVLRGGPTTVKIPSNSSKLLLWPVVAEKPGTASVYASATTFRASDAIRLPLPINPHGLDMTATTTVEAFGGSAESFFILPDDLGKARYLEVNAVLTTGYITVAMAALPYLEGYPYGCVEQTMSRFLPDIVVRQVARKYGLDVGDEEKLNEMIENGLKKLYGYQHLDGGWGWWKYDESTDEMTGYVMWGLALARNAGMEINPSVINAGLNYIEQRVMGDADDIVDLLFAYSFFRPLTDDMKDRLRDVSFDELTVDQVAKMAILADKIGMESISRRAIQALKEGKFYQPYYYWLNPEEEALAWKIMAFVETGSVPLEKVKSMADSLIAMRSGDRWSSTLTSAYSVMALTDLSEKIGERGQASTVKLKINGKSIFKGKILPGHPESIEVPMELLKPDTNSVELTSGRVKAFVSLTAEWHSTECPVPAHSSGRVRVRRELYSVNYIRRRGKWVKVRKKFDPSSGALMTTSRLEVVLTIEADEDVNRLIVEDPVLPGAEIDESDFMERYMFNYWYSPIAGFERKNDHIAFAVPYIGAGDTLVLSYTLILQNKGRFHLMPTMVYSMYRPEIRANSREFIIKVR